MTIDGLDTGDSTQTPSSRKIPVARTARSYSDVASAAGRPRPAMEARAGAGQGVAWLSMRIWKMK